ncbi:formin-1-like protein [Amazona aestiva]|uniref:Formin-1-like protein n=1 Tax=Amazona aestiva TaxID=12930 RepID=A0A0Q3P8U9_AMAAE|nr:formin-1-like protein [Amazona aestiva]
MGSNFEGPLFNLYACNVEYLQLQYEIIWCSRIGSADRAAEAEATKEEHKKEESSLENAQKCFEEIVGYFGIKPKPGEKEITPNYVFMVWYEFCSDFKTIWKRESKSISKERIKVAQQSVSKLTAEKKVETKKINPTASLV